MQTFCVPGSTALNVLAGYLFEWELAFLFAILVLTSSLLRMFIVHVSERRYWRLIMLLALLFHCETLGGATVPVVSGNNGKQSKLEDSRILLMICGR